MKILKSQFFTSTISGPKGTPTSALALGLRLHQALAIVIKSPHGFSASPYAPMPECSKDENVTIASNFSNVPFRYLSAKSFGFIGVNWGCSLIMSLYSLGSESSKLCHSVKSKAGNDDEE